MLVSFLKVTAGSCYNGLSRILIGGLSPCKSCNEKKWSPEQFGSGDRRHDWLKRMQLVLFDCDGTLVDSQQQIIESVSRAFDFFGLPCPARADILATVGLSLPQALAELLSPWPHIDPSVAAEEYRRAFFTSMVTRKQLAPLFEGARQVLEELSLREDLLLGIATGKSRRGLDALLEGHDLARYFSVLKTADDAASKPHPQMVLDACREMGVDPGKTVVVGDTSHDLAMANHAGARAVGVSWGYHPLEKLEEFKPFAIIRSFPELIPTLDRIWT